MAETLQNYARLARYYRALAEQRGHFDQQVTLLKSLFHRYAIEKTKRILDAACGTGDVVARLQRQGYEHVEGIDGCPELLARASDLPECERLRLNLCCWDEIERVLDDRGSFDCIFLLGNSIAHCEPDGIERLFKYLREHLSPGGLLAVDLRNWIRNASGKLREQARPIRVHRWLGEIRVGDDRFWMDDCCDYDARWQHVSYRFRRVCRDGLGWDAEDGPITVSYALFDVDDATGWLKRAGFADRSIEAQLPDRWSYIVLAATRSQ